MANWCINRVYITSIENLDAYTKLETWISNQSRLQSNIGKIPKDVDSTDEYLFDISFDENNPEYFSFESKWVPIIKTMVAIGKTYGFSFTLEFEELGMGLYGEYMWNSASEKLYKRELSSEELGSIPEDASSIYEEYDILLEEKEFKPFNLK